MKARLVAALWLCARVASAEAPGIDEFHAGVTAFQARDYAAALASFEASYRLRRAATALSNVALSQKALGRPASARATLRRLLEQHAAELSDADRAGAAATLAALAQDVAHLSLEITPADASVSIDGVSIGAARDVEVDPGARVVVATAPGYREARRTVDVASRARVELRLVETRGRLAVTADDPDAAIAVDGARRGYGAIDVELGAEVEHAVEVYKPGFESATASVKLGDGERRELHLPLGPRRAGPVTAPALPYDRSLSGPYVFVTATYYALGSGDPDRFARSGKTGLLDTTFFGARAGYLLVPTFGVEATLETGRQVVSHGCYPAAGACSTPAPAERASAYELGSVRAGLLGRYVSRARGDLRLIALGGVGLAHHALSLDPTSASRAEALPSGDGGAWNAFVHVEAGVELSVRRVLIDGVVAATAEGADAVKLGGRRVYTDDDKLFSIGLGLRAGYAF